MAGLSLDHPWTFTFGILGNIISLLVYLAPIPTFYSVYRKKSTEEFQSVPYVVALFSAMLWICYAFIKTDAYLLISISSIGCIIETIYITMYLNYAPRKARIYTAKIISLLGLIGFIVLFAYLLANVSDRIKVLGWVCVIFSVSVFVAPLSIIRIVIRTKSVEFMPFTLSFFLTLSAVVWFSYGLLTKDIYVAIPNILGFGFGVVQMVLYLIYKDGRKKVMEKYTGPEHLVALGELSRPSLGSEVHKLGVEPPIKIGGSDKRRVGDEGLSSNV